jgi:hypothetical protein
MLMGYHIFPYGRGAQLRGHTPSGDGSCGVPHGKTLHTEPPVDSVCVGFLGGRAWPSLDLQVNRAVPLHGDDEEPDPRRRFWIGG